MIFAVFDTINMAGTVCASPWKKQNKKKQTNKQTNKQKTLPFFYVFVLDLFNKIILDKRIVR